MPVTTNNGGVLKKLGTVSANDSGVIRNLGQISANDSGVIRTVFSSYKPVLADNSWEEIAKASAEGKASKIWNVGDEIDIVVSGETLTLVIVGFDHDDLTDGGKAGITFGLKNLMKDTRPVDMRDFQPPEGDDTFYIRFTDLEIYDWLSRTLFANLPLNLRSVIKNVNKTTWEWIVTPRNYASSYTQPGTDAMKIFLFSEVEVLGINASLSSKGEGSQYEYFKTWDNHIKKRTYANGSVNATFWHLRSPCKGDWLNHCYIKDNGWEGAGSYSNELGVCFGFCV